MKSMSLLLPLLFLGLNLEAIATGDDHRFIYTGFAGANLTLDGAATVTPNGLVELTNNTVRLKGHAFYPTPLHFRKFPNDTVQSFSVSFVFGIVPLYPDVSGHGLSLFVAPTKDFSSAFPTQYLGLFNAQTNNNTNSHIFAVELDTVQSTDFHDINDNHVGIDINSLTSVKSSTAGYYDDENDMFKNLTLSSQKAMHVWVDYDRETTKVNVTMAPLNMAKPVRPLLSVAYNLSLVLTDQAYIGFSSSTGAASAQHYLLGWSFRMNGPAPAIDVDKLPKLPHVRLKPDISKVLEIILPIATVVFLMATGITILLLVRRHMRYAELKEDWEIEFGPQRFSYKDLFRATGGFQNKNLLGTGGFERVYKGMLPVSKQEIAVKRISHDSKQSMKQFIAEIVSVGHLQHRNLVRLLGYCRRKGELLLVYDYMPNGSLDKYLHCEEGKPTLDWAQRFHIIKDIASGLLHLHEEWEKVVVHRDVKPSNVLLDKEMNGKLGDFGLSRLYDHGAGPQTTHVVGTIGYLAPELALTGKATPLADVYSFGMLTLEVTCGQIPIKQNAQGIQLTLVDWVLEHWHKGSLTDTVDIRLQGAYDVDEASLVLKLGLLCSHLSTNSRPNMRQVMQCLNGDMPLPETISTHPGFGMLNLMQNRAPNSFIMSYPSLETRSCGTMSDLSGGR